MGTFVLGSVLHSTTGYVATSAMVINFITKALAEIGGPIILERFGIDPALTSKAFVTTATDVVGLLAFLGFAAWVLF